jgi:hypothetical protein
MGIFTKLAQLIFAPVDENGAPRSPSMQEAQVWGTELERLVSLFVSSGGLIYSSKAALDADLARAPNTMVWVLGDPIADNNGIYGKLGASGSGSWTRRGDLPFSFIVASNAGAGTANAIQATTAIPVSGSSLIWMNIASTTTASPVTVAFNGGPALTIKSNSGNNIAIGGLVAGMVVLGVVSGANFRLVSDQASAVLVAAAEASALQAKAYRDQALAAAAGVTLPSAVASTYLRQKADLAGYETRTAAQTADDLNLAAVQIFGDSASRNARARFGDTLDIKEFGFDVSGAVGAEAANNAALDRLIAHATANVGMVYRARKGDVVRWSAAKTLPRCKLRTEGGRLHWVGNLSGSSSPALTLNPYLEFDALQFEVPAGGLFRRLARLSGDNSGDIVSIECENQIANNGGNNLDVAFAAYGHRNRLRRFRCKNVDYAGLIWGDGGPGAPQMDTTLDEFDIENYRTGMWIRNVIRLANPLGRSKGRSANALPDPGANGLVVESAIDSTFGQYELFDAAEHNFRFGGVKNGEAVTRNCTIKSVLSGRAGQSGVKIWSGDIANIIKGLTIGEINVFDAGFDGDALFFNDFGAMIQNVADSTIGMINVRKQDAAYSAYDGVYISQPTNLTIGLINSLNAQRNALRISQYNNNAADSGDVNTLNIGHLNAAGHLAEGIYIETPTANMRRINIDDFTISGGTDAVRWAGAADRAQQQCYIRGAATGQTGQKFNVPGSTSIKVVDKIAA